MEIGQLGDWARNLEIGQEGPDIIFTLGNRPQNNTTRLNRPLWFQSCRKIEVSIQLFLITLDRLDKSPGPLLNLQGKRGTLINGMEVKTLVFTFVIYFCF